jgi:CRP-like cAMP-binding protein
VSTRLSGQRWKEGRVTTPFFDYPVPSGEAPADEHLFMPDRTDAQWSTLVAHSERRRFRAGDDVIRRGDVDRALCIVVDGTVEARLSDSGLGRDGGVRMDAGSVMGEIAFLDGKPRSVTVRAVTDGELLRLTWESFERLRQSDPELAGAILFDLAQILAARLRQNDDFVRGWLG